MLNGDIFVLTIEIIEGEGGNKPYDCHHWIYEFCLLINHLECERGANVKKVFSSDFFDFEILSGLKNESCKGFKSKLHDLYHMQ